MMEVKMNDIEIMSATDKTARLILNPNLETLKYLLSLESSKYKASTRLNLYQHFTIYIAGQAHKVECDDEIYISVNLDSNNISFIIKIFTQFISEAIDREELKQYLWR